MMRQININGGPFITSKLFLDNFSASATKMFIVLFIIYFFKWEVVCILDM